MNQNSRLGKQGSRAVRFLKDTAGAAMTEFALLAPILILMTLGTFEVARAVSVHKRLQRATDMVADLVAREQSLGDTQAEVVATLNGIMRSAEQSMFPYNIVPMRMAIYSIRANNPPTGAPTTSVEWSYGYNNAPHAQCPAQRNLPQAGMVLAGNAVVMVESQYDYRPALNYGGAGSTFFDGNQLQRTFTDTIVYSPRNTCVDVLKKNCVASCSVIN